MFSWSCIQGAYHKNTRWAKEPKRESKRGTALDNNKAPVEKGKVKWERVHVPPSIPTTEQSYGYEENGRGELVRQAAPTKVYKGLPSDSIGPGHYSLNTELRRDDKGFSWYKSQTSRLQPVVRNTPGPGKYQAAEQSIDLAKNKSFSKLTNNSNFVSNVGRMHNHAVESSVVMRTPGPGYYPSKGTFDEAARKKPEMLQFFGSKAERNYELCQKDQLDPTLPGPGAYTPAYKNGSELWNEKSNETGGRMAPPNFLELVKGGGAASTRPSVRTKPSFSSLSKRFEHGFATKAALAEPGPGKLSYRSTLSPFYSFFCLAASCNHVVFSCMYLDAQSYGVDVCVFLCNGRGIRYDSARPGS